jgi:hypothetical protein
MKSINGFTIDDFVFSVMLTNSAITLEGMKSYYRFYNKNVNEPNAMVRLADVVLTLQKRGEFESPVFEQKKS